VVWGSIKEKRHPGEARELWKSNGLLPKRPGKRRGRGPGQKKRSGGRESQTEKGDYKVLRLVAVAPSKLQEKKKKKKKKRFCFPNKGKPTTGKCGR